MISINTSEFINYKKAIIDGVELGFRVANSAEALELLELQEQAQNKPGDKRKIIGRLLDIVFNTCDKPDKAKEILAGLSFEAVFDIYKRVIESE